MGLPLPATEAVLSVSELTHRIRDLLGLSIGEVWVRGEVGRVTYHGSGHVYLSLKDDGAVLEAAIWRSQASRLRFRLEEGQEVLAQGSIDVYAPRGAYKLIVHRIEPVGEGALRLAFEQLKRRLESEGLFAPERKRPLPLLPRRIALVTSRTGAAVRDLVTVIQRRLPSVCLCLVATRVQGEGAGREIAAAIERADREARADVVVVARGGGSLEDLWAFNEEVVARAIAASRVPVVSAVGHETDVTIADLVADLRAATPSHAGELVVPARADLLHRLDQVSRRLERALRRTVDLAWQRLEALAGRPALADGVLIARQAGAPLAHLAARLAAQNPIARCRARREAVESLGARLARPLRARVDRTRVRLDDLAADARRAVHLRLEGDRRRVAGLDDRLRALSPLLVLRRGYAIATREDGAVLRRGTDVSPGEAIRVRVEDGARIRARVEAVEPPLGETP